MAMLNNQRLFENLNQRFFLWSFQLHLRLMTPEGEHPDFLIPVCQFCTKEKTLVLVKPLRYRNLLYNTGNNLYWIKFYPNIFLYIVIYHQFL